MDGLSAGGKGLMVLHHDISVVTCEERLTKTAVSFSP
jgi:hypothetical protein